MNPPDVLRRAGRKSLRVAYSVFGRRAYSAADRHRSASDDGQYVTAVEDAVRSARRFRAFKRDPRYAAILEHVSREQGAQYLDLIRASSPELLAGPMLERFRSNDEIGSPRTYNFGRGVGRFSPTTLRYVKVLADLRSLFEFDAVRRIAEIGCGYGGQTLITDQWRVDSPRHFELFDLPCVLRLASKYLEAHVLNGSYSCLTLNQCAGDREYDLVISNYAFSELPRHVQLTYVRKVISRAARGYLTMNSGTEAEPRADSLRLGELRELIPGSIVLEERPLTAPDNYILVWGQQAAATAAGL